jgi:integrase
MAKMAKIQTRKATQRMHFTERRIEALPVPAKRRSVYDSKICELGLKLEVSGTKSFFWFRAVEGKPTWKTIGPWPAISLDSARAKVGDYNKLLADWKKEDCLGANPFKHTPRSQQVTLEQMVEDYITRHVMLEGANPSGTSHRVRWILKKYLADMRDRRLGSISRQDVFDLHKKIGTQHGKVTANRTVTLLRTVFNWGKDSGMWKGENPAERIDLFKEFKRERFLQPDEMVRFKKALDAEKNTDLRDFITLALSAGARRANICGMRWADINGETWTIKRTKNRKPHLVSLRPAALAVLHEREHRCAADCPWVFPSTQSVSGHIERFDDHWRELLKRAGLYHPDDREQHVVVHDIRRTFGSYQAIAGVSLQQIGAALGHMSTAATSIYARLHRESVENAVVAGERQMKKMMTSAKKRLAAGA